MKPEDPMNDPALDQRDEGFVRRKAIRAQAEAEFAQEQFRAAVEAEKAHLRARQIPWWQRLINRLFN